MHHSRLCAVLIDCKTTDVDKAARFWGEALGRPLDPNHSGSRGNYRGLETPPDEPVVQIQRVDHESRVHIDIESDDIPAEVARLEKVGAKVVHRLALLGSDAGADRPTLLRRPGTASRFPEERQPLGLKFDLLRSGADMHDRPHHLAQRRITYLLRRALGDLFLGTYDVTRSSILCDGVSPSHRT
jgi:hypothetical protein